MIKELFKETCIAILFLVLQLISINAAVLKTLGLIFLCGILALTITLIVLIALILTPVTAAIHLVKWLVRNKLDKAPIYVRIE